MKARQYLSLIRMELRNPLVIVFLNLLWVFTLWPLIASTFFPGDVKAREVQTLPLPFALFVVCSLSAYVYTPWMMRNGDADAEGWAFILSRPVSRRAFFRSKAMALLFVFMVPFLVSLSTSFLKPDLTGRMRNREETHEGLNVKKYQAAFPSSHVIEKPTTRTPQLLIPGAAPFAAGWAITAILLAATLCQFFCSLCWKLPRSSKSWQGGTIYLPQIIVLLLMFNSHNLNVLTETFLFYSEHWLPITAAVVVFGFLIHRFAEKRFENLEVI